MAILTNLAQFNVSRKYMPHHDITTSVTIMRENGSTIKSKHISFDFDDSHHEIVVHCKEVDETKDETYRICLLDKDTGLADRMIPASRVPHHCPDRLEGFSPHFHLRLDSPDDLGMIVLSLKSDISQKDQ